MVRCVSLNAAHTSCNLTLTQIYTTSGRRIMITGYVFHRQTAEVSSKVGNNSRAQMIWNKCQRMVSNDTVKKCTLYFSLYRTTQPSPVIQP